MDDEASYGEARRFNQLCALCMAASDGTREARRLLSLLALLEHPTALPPSLALRLGAELIALTAGARGVFVCEAAEGGLQ